MYEQPDNYQARPVNAPLRVNRFSKPIIGFIVLICVAFLIQGCSWKTSTYSSNTNTNDPFYNSIIAQYPVLEDHPFTTTKVKRIIDGDTFVITSGEKVRLIGINTPEIHGKVQFYGQEASNYTKKHLTGSTVYMFKDTSNTDKYGRLLRYLFIKNDTLMFNERLIREGYANTMTIPPDVLFSKKFTQLERIARNKELGLWQQHK